MSDSTLRSEPHDPNLDFTPYPVASQRPLAIGAFLLPAIVFYELVMVMLDREGVPATSLTSRNLIGTLFENFGVLGVHLPAVLLLATLIAQHLFARDPLRLHPRTPALMAAEGVAWSLPLIVLAGVLGLMSSTGESPYASPLDAAGVAVGAGLYEEFVFRLVLIAAVHVILADACRVKESVARPLTMLASAFAFASFHGIAVGGSVDLLAAGFYFVAGLFLSWLFLNRGLGIAAGAHIVYDLIVLVLVPLVARG